MIFGRCAIGILSLVVWLPTLAEAGRPAAGPIYELQQQVDRLTRQYDGLVGRLTAPTVAPELICANGLLATLRLDVSGYNDVAYYAVQEQGGNPPANFVIFVEPGLTAVTDEFDVEVGSATRTFLLVAGDTDGNVGRAVVEIAPDACLGPCPPDVICPSGQ